MTACPAIQVTDRVRFLARAMGLMFLLGWGAWFCPWDDLLDRQGTPLGADFSMFYVAGQVAADGAFDKLYDQAEHQRRLHELFPGLSPQFCLPFRYPPVVAVLLAPLSRLPYVVSWAVFTGGSCLALGTAIWLLTVAASLRDARPGILQPPRSAWVSDPAVARSKTGHSAVVQPLLAVLGHASRRDAATGAEWRTTAMWATISWPVALEVIIGGQASLFALLIAVASCVLLHRNRYIAAGAVLALSAYKPNVLAIFALGIAIRYPRVIWGAIPVVAAFVGLSAMTGQKSLVEFANLTTDLASRPWDVEAPFWKVHSLATWFEWMVPGRGKMISLLVGLVAAIAIGIWWRVQRPAAVADKMIEFDCSRSRETSVGCEFPELSRVRLRRNQALALLLVANALFNPYTPIYDLVLVAVAGWFATHIFQDSQPTRAFSPIAAQGLFAALFFGPHLSQSLARSLGLQIFPILLLAISLALVWVTSRKQGQALT